MFLHLGLMLMAMFLLSCLQIPNLAGNYGGTLKKNSDKVKPNIFVVTTLGNCGQSSCSIDGKWYIVISDAVSMILLAMFTIWIRANIVIFEHQVQDNVLSYARRTLLVEGCEAWITSKHLKHYFNKCRLA